MGTFPSKYKIKILDNTVGVINPPRRVPQTMLERLKIELLNLEKLKLLKRWQSPKNGLVTWL